MSKIVVIGGSGHVGSYLIPELVELGHEVINISRGQANLYHQHHAWKQVKNIFVDRRKEESDGKFGQIVADLHADIVIDMISFDLSSTKQIVEALKGKVEHYLFCSSIWVYGNHITAPSIETDPTNPIDEYGKGKAESEAFLMKEARLNGFPATCFRPGHIVGEGWVPTNPLGNSNPEVFSKIIRGEALILPNLGHETLHHVHAKDVAQWIICAIENRTASIGEIFNTTSERAITIRGYAETLYQWFGYEPKISYLPFDKWILDLGEFAENSKGHIVRSSCHSIEKSKKRLGYQPKYSSLQAIYESILSLINLGIIEKPKNNQ